MRSLGTDNNTEGRFLKHLGVQFERKVVGMDEKGSPLVVYCTNL